MSTIKKILQILLILVVIFSSFTFVPTVKAGACVFANGKPCVCTTGNGNGCPNNCQCTSGQQACSGTICAPNHYCTNSGECAPNTGGGGGNGPKNTPTPTPTPISPSSFTCKSMSKVISATNTMPVKYGDTASFVATIGIAIGTSYASNLSTTQSYPGYTPPETWPVKSAVFQTSLIEKVNNREVKTTLETKEEDAVFAEGKWTATYSYTFNTAGNIRIEVTAIKSRLKGEDIVSQ